MFFYAISGFLISYALDRKYQGARGTANFYTNRFVRIFSLYWPLLLIVWIVFPTSGVQMDFWARISRLFLLGSDWYTMLSHYPQNVFPFNPYLNPAWTLGAELTFYVLAPWILRNTVATVALFMFSVVLRIALHVTFGFPGNGWLYHFFPATICFFLAGHLVRLAYDNFGRKIRFEISAVLLGISVFGATRSILTGGFDSPHFYLSITAFVLSLPIIFEHTKANGWMNRLGEASYPMYLIHMPIIGALSLVLTKPKLEVWKELATGLFGRFGADVTCILFMLLVGVVGYLAHLIIERPAARAMVAGIKAVTQFRVIGSLYRR